LCIAQVKQSTCVIGHLIVGSSDVADPGVGSLVAALQGCEAKQVSSTLGGSGGAFLAPIHGGRVVAVGVNRLANDIFVGPKNGLGDDGPGQFQIGVGDFAGGVFERRSSRLSGQCNGGPS
jgi:hypothetical protein